MTVDKAALLQQVEQGWDEYRTYLASLSEEQLTVPTDAMGWTAKDHVIHIAIWENETSSWLAKNLRYESLGVDQATVEEGTDQINAVIHQRYQDLPLSDALRLSRQNHEQLMRQLESLTNEDLLRPYRHFDPSSDRENPIDELIIMDTYDHYLEHLPWIKAIAERE
jgi:hypothetical protein